MKASELERAKSLARRLQELQAFLRFFRSGDGYWERHSSDSLPGNTGELEINGRSISLLDLPDDEVKVIVGVVERMEARQLERVKAAGIEYDL